MKAFPFLRTRPGGSGQISGTHRFPWEALGEAILLLACVVPGFLLSYNSSQSPWNEFRLARAAISVQEQHIVTFTSSASGFRAEHSGGELIHTAIIETSTLPLESIALLPIGSLILAISYYAVSRKLTRSPWAAAAITLFASWYYPRLVSQYATHTYAWTNALFFTFLILLWYWLQHSTPTLSLLIMVIFTALFLHYHTTPVWVIAAVSVAAAFVKLNETSAKKPTRAVSWALPLFCMVLYLTFDTVVYGNAVARIQLEISTGGQQWFYSLMSRIAAPLLGGTSSVLGPFEVTAANPRVAVLTTFLVMLFLVTPVGVWCLYKVYRVIRTRNIRTIASTAQDVFCWAVLGALVLHEAIYSLYGSLSLRVIPLAFPLLLPLVLKEFKLAKALEVISAWALAGLAIIGFLGYIPSLQPDILTSETGLAYELFTPEDRLLAGANTYSSLLMASAAQGNAIGFVWPSAATYAAITGQRSVAPELFDYFVWDSSDKPIITLDWILLEPWTEYRQEIVQNPDLDTVYASEELMIFRPTGLGAPAHNVVPGEISVGASSFWRDALRLFISFTFLLVIPGAVLLFILHDTSLFASEPAPTRYGLTVGFSIAIITFIGYLANFSPLGLKWFIPICAILPWAVLATYIVVRRPSVRLNTQWTVRALLLIAILFIWAASSSWIAHARTENHRLQTEFFVTQTEPQSNSLAIHAVNRSEQTRSLSMVLESEGVEVQVLGPQLVPPNSLWQETWSIPTNLLNQRLSITLEENDTPSKELSLYLR